MFTPADASRTQRRRQAKEARGIEVAHRKALMDLRRQQLEALKAERRNAAGLGRYPAHRRHTRYLVRDQIRFPTPPP